MKWYNCRGSSQILRLTITRSSELVDYSKQEEEKAKKDSILLNDVLWGRLIRRDENLLAKRSVRQKRHTHRSLPLVLHCNTPRGFQRADSEEEGQVPHPPMFKTSYCLSTIQLKGSWRFLKNEEGTCPQLLPPCQLQHLLQIQICYTELTVWNVHYPIRLFTTQRDPSINTSWHRNDSSRRTRLTDGDNRRDPLVGMVSGRTHSSPLNQILLG